MSNYKPRQTPLPYGEFTLRSPVDDRYTRSTAMLTVATVIKGTHSSIENAVAEMVATLQNIRDIRFEIMLVAYRANAHLLQRLLTLTRRHAVVQLVRPRRGETLGQTIIRAWQAGKGGLLAQLELGEPGAYPAAAEMIKILSRQTKPPTCTIVVASRHLHKHKHGGPWLRRLCAWTAHALLRITLPQIGAYISDPLSQNYMFRVADVGTISLNPYRSYMLMELVIDINLPQLREIPLVCGKNSYRHLLISPLLPDILLLINRYKLLLLRRKLEEHREPG